MKNHSGRRSFLRFATSKRNRIISLCILPLVLLLSFLGSSRTVFASAFTYTDITNDVSVTNNRSASVSFIEFPQVAPTRFNIDITGTGTSTGTVTDFSTGTSEDISLSDAYDLDGTIIFDTMNYRYGLYKVDVALSSTLTGLNRYDTYSGYCDSVASIVFTHSNSSVTIIGTVLDSVYNISTFDGSDCFFSAQRVNANSISAKLLGSFTNKNVAGGVSPRLGVNASFYVLGRATITNNNFDTVDHIFTSGYVNATTTWASNAYKVYSFTGSELSLLNNLNTVTSNIYTVENLLYTSILDIYHSVDTVETLIASNTAAISNAQTAIASLLTTANATQSEIDSYLQLLYARNHTDLEALRTVNHQDLVNLLNKLEAFRSQQDTSDTLTRALIVNQIDRIIDTLNYDGTTTSQSIEATQSAYDAAQGVADAAVDAAVHNYTSDLYTVEAYDYSSFFTSQRNSAVFWRDVGEYILDSSNLGFVSGSIIIVTLIGLVIFMLRL